MYKIVYIFLLNISMGGVGHNWIDADLQAISKVPHLKTLSEYIFQEAYTVENCNQSNHIKEFQTKDNYINSITLWCFGASCH